MELIVDGRNVLEPVNLEENKNEIMRQRESVPSQVTLTHFKENVGLFRANVKGDDLNGLVTKLQDTFSDINTRESKIYDQLDTVFETVESIHKGSIEGVIVGVKSAQEAIAQAEYAIEQISETLLILQSFKTQLEDNTEHLNDIDIIWDATQQLNSDVTTLEKMLLGKVDDLKKDIESLQEVKNKLNMIKHLNDVDVLYRDFYDFSRNYSKDAQKNRNRFDSLNEQLENILDRLNTIEVGMFDVKKQEHLLEIDEMWLSCENSESEIKKLDNKLSSQDGKINEIRETLQSIEKQYEIISRLQYLSQVDNTWESVQEELEKMQSLEAEVEKLKSKTKILYYAFGGSLGIIILQIILNMAGVF